MFTSLSDLSLQQPAQMARLLDTPSERNPLITSFRVETVSAILFSAEASMREQPYDGLCLFGQSGSRKYLNAAERRRFLESAQRLPPPERLFCQVLA